MLLLLFVLCSLLTAKMFTFTSTTDDQNDIFSKVFLDPEDFLVWMVSLEK